MIHDRSRLDPGSWHPPLLVLVGMGMGKADLGEKALSWIRHAEVLAGGGRHLDEFPEHGGERIPIDSSLDAFLHRVAQASKDRRTVVLASGDPLFFGIGRRLVRAVGEDRVLVLPNITSVQAFFSRLAEPWEDVRVFSLHGRSGSHAGMSWLDELTCCDRMVLFTDPGHTPEWIARELIREGFRDRFLVVAEDLGLPGEKVRRFSLEEHLDGRFSPLNLVGVFREPGSPGVQEPLPRLPVFGLPEEIFSHEAGLITKLEIRAVVLALLGLERGLVLWDLGSGSGSVSIEACRIASLGKIFAVERNKARYRDLVENVRRFGCRTVRPVHGSAADVMNRLPDPDRVFIGGSGPDLVEILNQAASRLRPGGRVVQTAVTLDTLEAARSFWQNRSFDMSVLQLQVNRSVPIGSSMRLHALNPVFVVKACRSESA